MDPAAQYPINISDHGDLGQAPAHDGMSPQPAQQAGKKRSRNGAFQGEVFPPVQTTSAKKKKPVTVQGSKGQSHTKSKRVDLLRTYATPNIQELQKYGVLMTEDELKSHFKNDGNNHKGVSEQVYNRMIVGFGGRIPNFVVTQEGGNGPANFHQMVLNELTRSGRFINDWPKAHGTYRDVFNSKGKQLGNLISNWVNSSPYSNWVLLAQSKPDGDRKPPVKIFDLDFRAMLFAIRILLNRGSPNDTEEEDELDKLLKTTYLGFLLSPEDNPQPPPFWEGCREAFETENGFGIVDGEPEVHDQQDLIMKQSQTIAKLKEQLEKQAAIIDGYKQSLKEKVGTIDLYKSDLKDRLERIEDLHAWLGLPEGLSDNQVDEALARPPYSTLISKEVLGLFV